MGPELKLIQSLSPEEEISQLQDELAWVTNLVQTLRCRIDLLERKTQRLHHGKTETTE